MLGKTFADLAALSVKYSSLLIVGKVAIDAAMISHVAIFVLFEGSVYKASLKDRSIDYTQYACKRYS